LCCTALVLLLTAIMACTFPGIAPQFGTPSNVPGCRQLILVTAFTAVAGCDFPGLAGKGGILPPGAAPGMAAEYLSGDNPFGPGVIRFPDAGR